MSCPTLVCASSYSMAALLVAKLTPAAVTPLAPVSASCTVAAQLAHVIPSIGRIMRALVMSAGEFVRRAGRPPLARRLDAKQAFRHAQAAAERILAGLPGRGL